jgi:hypothetical protein
LKGRLGPIKQVKFISLFCAKLLKSDGIIKDFNANLNGLKNLSSLFANKYCTDLRLQSFSAKFEIFELEEISNDYVGVTGKVRKHNSSKLLIRTLDYVVWLEINSRGSTRGLKI